MFTKNHQSWKRLWLQSFIRRFRSAFKRVEMGSWSQYSRPKSFMLMKAVQVLVRLAVLRVSWKLIEIICNSVQSKNIGHYNFIFTKKYCLSNTKVHQTDTTRFNCKKLSNVPKASKAKGKRWNIICRYFTRYNLW